MATFHRMQDESGTDVVRCLVKGAPDQLLARAASRPDAEDLAIVPVDDEFKQRYMDENERLASQGLRVLATGRKDFDPDAFDPSADLLPLLDGLTVLALVGIVDPPRPTAKAAIATAHEAGIRVRMITGDHAVTAAAIAQRARHPRPRDHRRGVQGDVGRRARRRRSTTIGVIARVAPEDKVRLVETLKRKGDIVAMTGDGVNDAPALKAADIGIAMGITGTEVSKEAATMILTDDNFATIVKAVELGRGLYDNLTKYIRFQMGVLDRVHRHVPRREHLQRRRRRAVRAAPDAVRELHDAGAPGDRARLRPAGRGTDAAQAAARPTSRSCRGRS